MVSATKLAASQHRPFSEESQGKQSRIPEEDGARSVGTASDLTAELPLSFGEQLVLETYLHCRRRPYDRQRQEALSQPRRTKATADSWGSKGCNNAEGGTEEVNRALLRRKVEDSVSRLSAPKKSMVNKAPAGESIAVNTQPDEERSKRTATEVSAMLDRLAAPRIRRPHTPEGEKLTFGSSSGSSAIRPVNLQRLSALSKPTKRGASCSAWGVSKDWIRPATSRVMRDEDILAQEARLSTGSRSARGDCGGTGFGDYNTTCSTADGLGLTGLDVDKEVAAPEPYGVGTVPSSAGSSSGTWTRPRYAGDAPGPGGGSETFSGDAEASKRPGRQSDNSSFSRTMPTWTGASGGGDGFSSLPNLDGPEPGRGGSSGGGGSPKALGDTWRSGADNYAGFH
mmetsp:Transcript_102131/g.218684  ORF Transcript_102131/g.218684 Transcript_102131/m.218684 type:complete len:397 (-) Transcript_102131:19-1209(-)